MKTDIKKFKKMCELSDENKNKLFYKLPNKIKSKIIIKICTDKQINQIIDENIKNKNTKFLRVLLKEFKKHRQE